MHLLAMYLLFLPPLLFGRHPGGPVAPGGGYITDAAATQYDYGVDDPSFSAELPGKPPPLITRYRLFFSLLVTLE